MTTRAERLKQARMRVNLTQVEAAKRLAKAVSTIKGWESNQGTEPATLNDVARVCKLYDISIDYYVNGHTPSNFQANNLNRNQRRLIEAFGHLSPAAQHALMLALEQLADDITQ